MINNKSIFNEEVLNEIPIFYRLMREKETNKIGELYLKTRFSKSKKHFSKNYKVVTSHKPISNFIIRMNE